MADTAPTSSADRSPSLLAWQWSGYETFHLDRTNHFIHALTQPIFVLGFLSVLSLPGPIHGPLHSD